MKKIISMLLVLTVICSTLICATVTTNADSVIESALSWALDTANDNSHRYVLGASHSENEGTHYDCSSFVSWALRHAGLDVPISTTFVMRDNFEPFGFEWIPWSSIGGTYNLQRGDILLDEDTHVEFYYGNNQMLGAHNPNSGISLYGYYNNAYGVSWDGVLRYNAEPEPLNIGDTFYAFIINTKMWKHLTVEQNNNVVIKGEKSHYCADQIWKFERQSDNSYKIISTANGQCLDVDNASGESGTNVKTCNDNGNNAQRWFVYNSDGGFVLQSKCSDCVLDITGGYSEDGTNVQMFASNDTYSQKFTVYQLNENRPFAANLGSDFTAPILNLKEWITIENNDDWNVSLQKETGKSNQLWRFIRQIDGSYKIYSCFDGNCIDLDNAAYENGTNIKIWDSNDNDAQRWYFYEYGGGYAIQSKLSGKFFDVASGSLNYGTNIQAWEWNGTDAQVFAVYRGDECKLGAVNLSVVPNKGSAVFNWSTTYGETAFVLKLWQGKALEGDPYLVQKSIPSRTNNLSIDLPAGYYEGYILSQNYYESFTSNTVSFTVEEPDITTTILLGDVNGDDDVDSVDATIIQRVCTMIKVPFAEEQLIRGDVDGDGSLTTVDATFIQRFSTRVTTPYHIGELITQ